MRDILKKFNFYFTKLFIYKRYYFLSTEPSSNLEYLMPNKKL